MIKRTIAFVLTALTVALAIPFSAFAADGEAVPTVTVGSAEVSYRMEKVTVPIMFENAEDINKFTATLTFDSSFELIGIDSAREDHDEHFEFESGKFDENNNGLGDFTWSGGNTADPTGTFTLCYATFSVSRSAKPGVYPIELAYEPENSLNSDGANYHVEVKPGSITLTDTVIYGDTNRDGKVTANDAIDIIRRLAKYEIDVDLLCADVNLDDRIDINDAVLILRNLAGWLSARLGHRDKYETLTAATCQNGGEMRLTCIECGDSVIIATGKSDHSYQLGKCTVCGAKSADYPLITYCDYLKKKAIYDDNLRGYAIYETLSYDGYRLFVSNIYDDKTDSLCLFATAYFDSGLVSTLSVDIDKVTSDGKYSFYYDCAYNNSSIATLSGSIGPNPTDVYPGQYAGDADSKGDHGSIAGAIARECFVYMQKLLAESGLDVTVEDFRITLGK